MTFYPAEHGLTSQQAWSQAHIVRCSCCGAWECLTNFEALMRAAPGYKVPAMCSHLQPQERHDTKGHAA